MLVTCAAIRPTATTSINTRLTLRTFLSLKTNVFLMITDAQGPNCHRIVKPPQALLSELDERCALTTLILRSLGHSGYMGMTLKKVAHAPAQDAGAVAVNHAHSRQSRKKSPVEIFLKLFSRLVDRAADQIDLHAHVIGVCAQN